MIIMICQLAAASHIENVAMHINESIRKQDNFKKMLSIQNSLTGLTAVPSIISPARSFIKGGKMMKVSIRYHHSILLVLVTEHGVCNNFVSFNSYRYVVERLRKGLYFCFLTCYFMLNKIYLIEMKQGEFEIFPFVFYCIL